MTSDLDIRHERDGDGLRLGLSGEFDINHVATFDAVLADAIAPEPTQIVIDCRQVTLIDSMALNALLRLDAQVGSDCEIVIVPSPVVRQVLEVVGLAKRFALRDEAPPGADEG